MSADQDTKTITPAIRKWIGRAKEGRIFYSGPRGFGRAAWERCMKRAERLGLVTENAWGEFDLTELGHKIRAESAGENT